MELLKQIAGGETILHICSFCKDKFECDINMVTSCRCLYSQIGRNVLYYCSAACMQCWIEKRKENIKQAKIDKLRPRLISEWDEDRFNIKRNDDGTYTQLHPCEWSSYPSRNGDLTVVHRRLMKAKTANKQTIEMMKLVRISEYPATGAARHYNVA